MKKAIENNKNTIIVIIVILIIVFLITGMILLLSNKTRTANDSLNNKYTFEKNTGEIRGTVMYTTDTIKSEHCFEGICISELTFYYLDKNGRIDFEIINRNQQTVSGCLEADFGFIKLKIPYDNLEPNEVKKNSSYYENVKLKEVDDYQLNIVKDE